MWSCSMCPWVFGEWGRGREKFGLLKHALILGMSNILCACYLE